MSDERSMREKYERCDQRVRTTIAHAQGDRLLSSFHSQTRRTLGLVFEAWLDCPGSTVEVTRFFDGTTRAYPLDGRF